MIINFTKQLFQDISASLNATADAPLTQSQLHSLIEAAARKCNLVSREEFDAQQAVLLKTREKLERLEAELAELNTEIKNDHANNT